jgi:hypothetical protein
MHCPQRLGALLLPLMLLAAGCSSPPSPIDMTPQFVPGATRLEGVQAFMLLDATVKEFNGHLGISWHAKVKSSGPQGAVIEATVVRLVLQTPVGFGIDTDSFLPLGMLGDLPVLGPLLYKLIGKSFVYVVSPSGEVTVTKWEGIVARAANQAGVKAPKDGSIPSQGRLESALSRAYGAVPYQSMKLGEGTERSVDYVADGEGGPRISGRDQLTYEGFGEAEFDYGSDEMESEGLSLTLGGGVELTGGRSRYGIIRTGKSRRSGQLIVSENGRELLYYRASHRTKIYPDTEHFWLNGIKIATYETGWIFFGDPWD